MMIVIIAREMIEEIEIDIVIPAATVTTHGAIAVALVLGEKRMWMAVRN